MGSKLQNILTSEDILFILSTIGAVMALFLLMHFLSRQESSSYIGIDGKNRRNKRNTRNTSNETNKTPSNNNPIEYSHQSVDKRTEKHSDKTEHISLSNDDHHIFAQDKLQKQNQEHQKQNADGTVRTEILFDSNSENFSAAPLVPRYEYLDTANNGQFRKRLPSDEKSFFRTWLENGTRLFEFHGNVEKALANINAIFDDVCEIEGKQNGATQIHNVEPGILDSQLKIEKKAKIKLI